MTGLKIFALKLTIHTLSPKNPFTICKFFKIDHAQTWKILYQHPSGIFQELKTIRLAEHFRSINLTFDLINAYTYTTVTLQRSKKGH